MSELTEQGNQTFSCIYREKINNNFFESQE